MGGGALCLSVALIEAYSWLAGVPRSAVPNLNGMLITLPAFFLWIPVSLLISNVVLYWVPPLRRIADAYTQRAHRLGFVDSQKALLKALGVFALVCLPLIVLGFAL